MSQVSRVLPPGKGFKVCLDQEGIRFEYEGRTVLFWSYQEIEEDEQLGPQVGEAILQAYLAPKILYDFLYSKEKLLGQSKF